MKNTLERNVYWKPPPHGGTYPISCFSVFGEFFFSLFCLWFTQRHEIKMFLSNMIKFYFLTIWKFLIIKHIPKGLVSLQSCSLFYFHKISPFFKWILYIMSLYVVNWINIKNNAPLIKNNQSYWEPYHINAQNKIKKKKSQI